MPLITFVVPVRHPENTGDWAALTTRLAQTARSIAAQTHADWRAVVVANTGAVLPALPAKFAIERVTLPPNPLYERGSAPREQVFDAVRLDKGRRVLAGMLSAKDSRFFMVVDDDDLVSAGLTAHLSRYPEGNGWRFDRGYLWSEGSVFLFEHDDFASVCGTSLVVRSDLYRLPRRRELARDNYVKNMLGSHKRIDRLLRTAGTPLESLPFRGAVYRVGHAGAHSQSRSVLRSYLADQRLLGAPRKFISNVKRLRFLSPALRREFFAPG